MKVLTSAEVEELTEHLDSRPDIWLRHNDMWVRKLSKEPDDYALALKVSNGLPNEFYGLVCKPIQWSAQGCDEYLEWLLAKYTAYGVRMHVVKLIRPVLKPTVDANAVSRSLCEVQGGTFIRRRQQSE